MRRSPLCAIALLVLLLCAPALRGQTSPPPPLEQAFLGVNTLQSWYQPATGLYATTGWWNAANSITALANYSRLDRTDAFYPTFQNTLEAAPHTFANFLNDYYDDEGWWALAWIDVYDLTGDARYLAAAQTIFTDMTGGWDGTCGGGIWWSKARGYKNAIANELFLSVAASLAARAKDATQRASYLDWAQREWTWFHGSGMINASHTINDGLTSSCQNNGQTVWSYNQGVILGGLAALSKLSSDNTLLPQAQSIANAAITALSDNNGILHDVCEPNCGADGNQFKGVFLRNLVPLQALVNDPRYTSFAVANANSIFTHDRSSRNEFGVVWSGPFDNNPNAASQTSALDAILAAAAMTAQGGGGGAAPGFRLTLLPATLTPGTGASAQSTVALVPDAGFGEVVQLAVHLNGAPAGLTAQLGSPTLSGSGTTPLTVSTTSTTPGGTYSVAVTGTSHGLFQAAYVSVALPDFSLAPAQGTLYLNQNGKVEDTIQVQPLNGFDDYVSLAPGPLPEGVLGLPSPSSTATSTRLALAAGTLAPTGTAVPFTLTGTSGATTHTTNSLSVAVSAAVSSCGYGVPVDLSAAYNLAAVHSEGMAYSDGGVDGLGYSYSSALVGSARMLSGVRFRLGPADRPDAVSANGQLISLPAGRYSRLEWIGAGLNGRQANQVFAVRYTDGTITKATQSLSDWYAVALNPNEGEAIAMPYRLQSNGSPQSLAINLYRYAVTLDPTRTVQSLLLPVNRSVVVMAATLLTEEYGQPIALAPYANVTAVTADGTASVNGGADGLGYSYSGTVLGTNTAAGVPLLAGTAEFSLLPSNVPDAVFANGQTIPVPAGTYTSRALLGSGVGGNQVAQPLVLHYADGSSETRSQTFSDWFAASDAAGEALAIRTPYRNRSDGTPDAEAFNVYLYSLGLPANKKLSGITLPVNRNVLVLGMTALPPSRLRNGASVCGMATP